MAYIVWDLLSPSISFKEEEFPDPHCPYKINVLHAVRKPRLFP